MSDQPVAKIWKRDTGALVIETTYRIREIWQDGTNFVCEKDTSDNPTKRK